MQGGQPQTLFPQEKSSTTSQKDLHAGVTSSARGDNIIATVNSDHKEARQCYNAGLKAHPSNLYPIQRINLVYNFDDVPTLAELDPRSDRDVKHKGYNQILMHLDDQEKITFIIEHENFCYNVVPFGLKNADAIYQRLMDKVFQNQVGRNMEVYVEDMVVKSKNKRNHHSDLEEVFKQLRRYNMRLNSKKCAFRVQGGKFLEFTLTYRGIEANLEKCRAVLEMKSPKKIKEVQQLTGHLVALSRFSPTAAVKSYQFFNSLRGIKASHGWMLVKNHSPISKAFLSPRLYYASRRMNVETWYPTIEKLAFALTITLRCLHHYFQSRLIKWLIELSEYGISYQSKEALKSQILANFIAEFTTNDDIFLVWELYIDGASNEDGCGAGIILKDKTGVYAEQSITFLFKTSNKQFEYEAFLAGLRLAREATDWRTPYVDYLKSGNVPASRTNPRLFKRKASHFTLIGDDLYKRGFSRMPLKCLRNKESDLAMSEVHEGICGTHIGKRSLAAKLLRAGYFWPSLKNDCMKKVQHYDNCQKCAPKILTPAELLHISEITHKLKVIEGLEKKGLNL
ncbi:uncharacterized protein LOC130933882 [Arachis stenosperma]|uniref:uncharacterized protein LOC130933882 n=1 Tax=Arachis stenosperma TaxID=217475 RepID=UPI0025ABEAE5|nr:uncharacterized protein LOC130933882 [Arachis stenosperma]